MTASADSAAGGEGRGGGCGERKKYARPRKNPHSPLAEPGSSVRRRSRHSPDSESKREPPKRTANRQMRSPRCTCSRNRKRTVAGRERGPLSSFYSCCDTRIRARLRRTIFLARHHESCLNRAPGIPPPPPPRPIGLSNFR